MSEQIANPFQKIITLLDDVGVSYELLEHEPIWTSEDAARVRGFLVAEGAKSLLLKADGEFVLIVIPGDRRLSSSKLRKLLNARDVRFARPEEVKRVMGCEVGACYPIGNFLDVRTIVDASLGKNEYVSFNIGRHDRSVRMRWEDFKKVAKFEIADVVEDND